MRYQTYNNPDLEPLSKLIQLGFKYNKQVTSMKTYSMKKRAYNYVYLKRKLLSCGIHTKTLNI